LRRGVVVNIESTLRSIAAAVENAEMMSGREVSEVLTGIAGSHIEGINSRGVVAVTGRDKEITQEDIDRVIDAAKAIVIPMDREILHIVPQEYIVDDQRGVKNPLDMIGVRLESEVHIITGSVTSAQNLVKCVNRAGFHVQDIVLQTIASADAVLSLDEKELGCILIDLGSGTTNTLTFIEGAPYHTSVVNIGQSQVSSDLSIILKTPIETAEEIKKKSSCCYLPLVDDSDMIVLPGVGSWPSAEVPRTEICKIVQPRMAEIFQLIKEQIDRNGYGKQIGGGVILTGGGALMKGAIQLASEIFRVPARVGIPRGPGGLVAEYQSPVYATAVGLVMWGYERMKGSVTAREPKRSRKGSSMNKFKDWLKEFF
jgi:cell division protein FtsA